jgi:signal transduction histidine kinase
MYVAMGCAHADALARLGAREIGQVDLDAGLPPPDPATLRAAYRAETASAFHAWLGFAAALFLFFLGIGAVMEGAYHPERTAWAIVFYGGCVAACAAALGLSRLTRAPTEVVSVVFAAVIAILLSGYARTVGAEAEVHLMAHICLMCGLASILPLGWRAQVAMCVVSVATFWSASPALAWSIRPGYGVLGLAAGAVISVVAAASMEAYRYAAFLRSALLAHASAASEAEAEIATALFHVGQTLHAHLDADDLVAHVNELAVDVLGCDDDWLFLWDDKRRAFRVRAHSGIRSEIPARAVALELSRDGPVAEVLRPGRLCEIADAARQSLVPPETMALFDCASLLAVPLSRRDEVIGFLVFSHRARRGPFSAKEHRLAFGIAHAATVSLENGRLLASLQATTRLKSEFLSTMSHELRTPLNVITGYADILAGGALGPLTPAQADAIARIRRSARDQLDLIETTLDLNRLDAGREVIQVSRVDFDALFAEVRKDLGATDDALVALRWRNAVNDRDVRTDCAKLKAILKHLVSNALKFTPEGEVEVTVRDGGGPLVLEVRDTGIGIAPDDLPTIFEMFRQVDGSHTRRYGGVGLGLHVVKRLVERLGGTIAVASRPGAGSVFTVTIPPAPNGDVA